MGVCNRRADGRVYYARYDDANMALTLVRIVAPHFVAGLGTDGTVRRTANILAYMAGWPDDRVREYCKQKG